MFARKDWESVFVWEKEIVGNRRQEYNAAVLTIVSVPERNGDVRTVWPGYR